MYHIMQSKIIELRTAFHGRGEVRGYNFRQIEKAKKAYLYEVSHPDVKRPHYEVFLRKINRRFGAISLPSGEAFGLWAWTYPTLNEARAKLAEITWGETCPDLPCVMGEIAVEISQ